MLCIGNLEFFDSSDFLREVSKMLKKKYLWGLILAIVAIFVIVSNKYIARIVFAQAGEENSENQAQIIMQHFKRGENVLTIKLAKEYLASNPNDITTINVLTEAYINEGNFSSAEATVKGALAMQPNDAWSCRLLGRIYSERNRYKKDPNVKSDDLALALEQVERGLASSPNDAMLLAEAAQIYAKQGDKAKANQTIDKALNLMPKDLYLIQIKGKINEKIEKMINK